MCSPNATCTNGDGGYNCSCNTGYSGDGIMCFSKFEIFMEYKVYDSSLCKDMDECSEQTHTCNINAYCMDTDGSFLCLCNDGFTGNGIYCTGQMNNIQSRIFNL